MDSSPPSDEKNLSPSSDEEDLYPPPDDEEKLLEMGRDTGKCIGVRLPYIRANRLFQVTCGPGWTVTGRTGKQ